MTDPRMVNLARILVHYSTKIKPKDRVAIIGETIATPLLREIYREILRAGGYPHLFIYFDGFKHLILTEANDDQLCYVSPIARMVYDEFEGVIELYSQSNTRDLTNVNPERQSLWKRSRADLMKSLVQRGASGELKWTLSMFPTQAYAQDAEMSLTEFEDFVYSTTYADSEDPVGKWQQIHDEQQRLVDWLVGKKRVEVKGPEVDLTLSIEGRTFTNSDGTHNMPSGEIYTGPVEDSANGWVRFTFPAVDAGREIEGIEFHFEQGKVVKATAEKNEEYLLAMLDTDAGSRYLGEFGIGTNKKINRFTKNILFDEKIGGTMHVALGAGYPETGAKNESAIHIDLICDMRNGGQIIINGELFYESGEFKI